MKVYFYLNSSNGYKIKKAGLSLCFAVSLKIGLMMDLSVFTIEYRCDCQRERGTYGNNNSRNNSCNSYKRSGNKKKWQAAALHQKG
ncbi:hypothetical protein [Pontibacter akesuensis]|uniref:hypothetical protein n=1 Tax=Pontibacter akesuensis TaxID=388950 RepID=UPI0015600486|nr:hypothetical protein [Pontibacter akesuensis]